MQILRCVHGQANHGRRHILHTSADTGSRVLPLCPAELRAAVDVACSCCNLVDTMNRMKDGVTAGVVYKDRHRVNSTAIAPHRHGAEMILVLS